MGERKKWKGSERKSVGEAIHARIYSKPVQPHVWSPPQQSFQHSWCLAVQCTLSLAVLGAYVLTSTYSWTFWSWRTSQIPISCHFSWMCNVYSWHYAQKTPLFHQTAAQSHDELGLSALERKNEQTTNPKQNKKINPHSKLIYYSSRQWRHYMRLRKEPSAMLYGKGWLVPEGPDP